VKREERSLRPRRSSAERKTVKKKCVTRCDKSERCEEYKVKGQEIWQNIKAKQRK